jgi:hypothetical protein
MWQNYELEVRTMPASAPTWTASSLAAILVIMSGALGACIVEDKPAIITPIATLPDSKHVIVSPTGAPVIGTSIAPPSATRRCADFNTPYGTDKYCVSSVIKSDAINRFKYGPESLFDGANDTAWVEGVDGQGIGEWVIVEFDQTRMIHAIIIHNGYNKDRDIYLKNSRVKELTVEFSKDQRKKVLLKDSGSPQPIPLPKDQPLRANKVKLTIESVYPGTKWDDTAISELHIDSSLSIPQAQSN